MNEIEIKLKCFELGLIGIRIIVDIVICIYDNHCRKK